jgi:hypothetical protein
MSKPPRFLFELDDPNVWPYPDLQITVTLWQLLVDNKMLREKPLKFCKHFDVCNSTNVHSVRCIECQEIAYRFLNNIWNWSLATPQPPLLSVVQVVLVLGLIVLTVGPRLRIWIRTRSRSSVPSRTTRSPNLVKVAEVV